MQNERIGDGCFQVIKSVGVALGLSLLCTVIFASVLSAGQIPRRFIYPVNQTIKVLCACVGAFLFIRDEKGFWKGCAVGALYSALSYLTFSAIGGNFSASWILAVETLLTAFAGSVGGAIAVNLRRG